MFNSIPQNRLFLYILFVGILPIVIAWIFLSSQLDASRELQENMQHLQDQAFIREKKQAVNMAVRSHFRDADHFYIDKHLETLSFLEPEIESLKSMLHNPNFPEDENIKKRLENLSGQGNNMIFTEGVVQSTPIFQEVTETLVHPVEVNVDDLRKILCHIEGIAMEESHSPENRPQLIILDFKLDKKNVSEKNQVFLLNLKLLKREFL